MQPGETIAAPHMGMRVTCRESAATTGGEAFSFSMWISANAAKLPMHVHPHQEERITVISGSLRSRMGKVDRVLSAGETVISPPGEAHTIAPAGEEDVEILGELRPALAYERFVEQSFALDRAGYVNAKGRGNPLRMATAGAREAEFFLAGLPASLQRPLLTAMERIARRLGYEDLR